MRDIFRKGVATVFIGLGLLSGSSALLSSQSIQALRYNKSQSRTGTYSHPFPYRRNLLAVHDDREDRNHVILKSHHHNRKHTNAWAVKTLQGVTLSLILALSPIISVITTGGSLDTHFAAMAEVTSITTTTNKAYDGFADYAKDNKMQQSDVACFIQKCGQQTKALFSNPRGIKGVSCLGRCKGEQSCATRCFAEYGSEDLNNWLSCTIEENECVKVPRNIDNSAENLGYASAVNTFDPNTLVGTWYKTNGLNPNYDLFDCQTNTFKPSTADNRELDMDIFFRVSRPETSGGGYWENSLTEHMVLDTTTKDILAPAGRNMHTQGKMYGLQFSENWFIIGESDGKENVPPFKLVAYRGHTLQVCAGFFLLSFMKTAIVT